MEKVSSRLLLRLQKFALRLKQNLHVLYLTGRDTRTPKLAKFIIIIVLAYALSPIDLIPNFIPVLGLLDDLILLPLGILLALRLTPDPILHENRLKAQQLESWQGKPSFMAAACVFVLWIILAAMLIIWFF